MAKKTSMIELRKMQAPDLEREIAAKRMHLTKVHLGVELRQEKDTAKVRFERRELARLLTALGEKRAGSALNTSAKPATLSASAEAPAKAAPKKRAPKAAKKTSTPKK